MPYNPEFITNHVIPLPTPSEAVLSKAYGRGYIHYSRHSILFNEDRGLAFAAAHNIDGSTLSDNQFTSRNFKSDPNITPKSLQIDNDRGYRESETHNYGPNPWDRGHLARRKSLSWGSESEASIAERESDYWSNIAPQHENLHDDAWGKIEDWMLKRVENDNHRACVFTGPIFTASDPTHKNGPNEIPIRIPAGFWKVISIELNNAMRSAGFLVWQRDYDNPSPLTFSPVLEQVRLTTIEVLTGLTFPALRQFDPLLFDSQSQVRATATGASRETMRERMMTPSAGAPMDNTDIDDELVMEATAPGTAAIKSMRDIVL